MALSKPGFPAALILTRMPGFFMTYVRIRGWRFRGSPWLYTKKRQPREHPSGAISTTECTEIGISGCKWKMFHFHAAYSNVSCCRNDALFRICGNALQGIDLHRYWEEILDPEKRKKWPVTDYSRTMTGFPTFFGQLLPETSASAKNHWIQNLMINIGEWGMLGAGTGWPRASLAHATFTAGMHQAYIRQSESVRFSYLNDLSLNYRPTVHYTSPLSPDAYVQKLFAEPFRTHGLFYRLPLAMNGPVFSLLPISHQFRPIDSVPFVDSAAIVSELGDRAYVFLTNRNLWKSYDLRVAIPTGWKTGNGVSVSMLSAADVLRSRLTRRGRKLSNCGSGGFSPGQKVLSI